MKPTNKQTNEKKEQPEVVLKVKRILYKLSWNQQLKELKRV